MDKQQTWKEWEEQEKLITSAARRQGKIIRAYIEANWSKLKSVEVKMYYGSSMGLITMLQIPPTYNTYYYRQGQFYRQVQRSGVDKPVSVYVDMVIGDDLIKLFKNVNFVKSFLGMDTIGGSCPPGAM